MTGIESHRDARRETFGYGRGRYWGASGRRGRVSGYRPAVAAGMCMAAGWFILAGGWGAPRRGDLVGDVGQFRFSCWLALRSWWNASSWLIFWADQDSGRGADQPVGRQRPGQLVGGPHVPQQDLGVRGDDGRRCPHRRW